MVHSSKREPRTSRGGIGAGIVPELRSHVARSSFSAQTTVISFLAVSLTLNARVFFLPLFPHDISDGVGLILAKTQWKLQWKV